MADSPYPDSDRSDGDLERILTVLSRRAGLIVLCTLVTAFAAVGFSLLQEKQYTASTSLLFRDPKFTESIFGTEGTAFSGGDAARQAATNLQLVGLKEISERTAADPDIPLTGGEIDERVDVAAEGQSDVISISATDPDPELSALLANSFAAEFIEFRAAADRSRLLQAQRLADRQFDQLSPEEQGGPRGAQLSRGAERLGIIASLQTGNAELVQAAETPTSPSSPKPVRNGIMGFFVGLMLGLGLAFLFERLNRTVRDPSEAAEAFGLPVLGTIPESEAIATSEQLGSDDPLPFAETEAFRMLRASLRYFNVDQGLHTLMVTSASAEEGKTTVAWNLAAVAAAGSRVLVLETDLRSPSLAHKHGLNSGPGLTEVLTRQVSPSDAIQSHEFAQGNGYESATHSLDVLVAGSPPPNPGELLESDSMSDLLAEVSEHYDLVVIDTAPAGIVADPYPLMEKVNGIVVVSRINRTNRDEAAALTSQLDKVNAPALGVVANAIRRSRRDRYGYGYGYGYGERSSSEVPTRN